MLVITIAHRLKTIIDCDVVLVLSRGAIAEAGPPHVLLLPPGASRDEAKVRLRAVDMIAHNSTLRHSYLSYRPSPPLLN